MAVKWSKSAIGFTLVEVMLAITILTVMALGGVAFVCHSKVGILNQAGKRVAAEIANSRLEEIYASQYNDINDIMSNDYDIHYLSGQVGSWTLTDNDPGETKNINGKTLPIVTRVRYMDIDEGPDSYDYIQVTVSAGYRTDISDTVTVDTFRFP